jgi:type IX secretion system PorP/SprF family membrane protein
MKKQVLLVLLLSSCFTVIYAQLPPVSDQYIFNPVIINPAFTGARGSLSIAAFYRSQWTGIKGAPETLTLSADAPYSDTKSSFGFMLMRDRIGVTRSTSFSTAYAYRTDAWKGNLSLGLKAGILTTHARWSDLVAIDPGDEPFLSDSRVHLLPDFGFGAYYSNSRVFAGFSIPRLLQYDFHTDNGRYSVMVRPGQYLYMLNAGYSVTIAPEIRFIPSALLSLTPGEKSLLDINALFSFSERLWGGITYRTNKSLAGLFQFGINPKLKFAYTYFIDFNRLGSFSNGSHEIMLRYDFQFKADIVNPLIF